MSKSVERTQRIQPSFIGGPTRGFSVAIVDCRHSAAEWDAKVHKIPINSIAKNPDRAQAG